MAALQSHFFVYSAHLLCLSSFHHHCLYLIHRGQVPSSKAWGGLRLVCVVYFTEFVLSLLVLVTLYVNFFVVSHSTNKKVK